MPRLRHMPPRKTAAQRARDEEFDKEVGRRLSEALRASRYNASGLADDVGVSRSLMSLFLSGKRRPKIDTLSRIADRLGVPLDDLRPTVQNATNMPHFAEPAAPTAVSRMPEASGKMPLSEFLTRNGDELFGRERKILEKWARERPPSGGERPTDYGTESDWWALVRLIREEYPPKLGG